MNQVYIVTTGEYDDYKIESVWSTKVLADAEAMRLTKAERSYNVHAEVEMFVVDDTAAVPSPEPDTHRADREQYQTTQRASTDVFDKLAGQGTEVTGAGHVDESLAPEPWPHPEAVERNARPFGGSHRLR